MAPTIINRRVNREYEILEKYEAGIQLTGSEIKSLRIGKANIGDSYADPRDEELWLINCHISEYTHSSNQKDFSPLRPRKLLLHKKEIRKLSGSVQKKGLSIVVLKIYFNNKGFAKVELGLGRGKKDHDKRAYEKQKDWQREKLRLLRNKD
ncbi:MAG: SsrA-binding protein [Pelagibacterales bacterium]|nr:SsrA-binding protein [Pelagibacterales bacterium]|tara:strand:- start:32 stop:484 length:453 start_codon:yes stop_codon:yes gene_type:complete